MQKLTTTFELLRKALACAPRYKFLREALGAGYGDTTPINLLTILETNGIEDALWALCATVEDCEKIARLMAADFAEMSLPNWTSKYPNDARPALVIQAARDFANGLITLEQRSAAWSAARSAARFAAESAAWSAAWSAARSAAQFAAESAAWSAAESAARFAAESAAFTAAESAAWFAAWSAARSTARFAAWSAAESAAESAAWSAARLAAESAQEIIFRKYLSE